MWPLFFDYYAGSAFTTVIQMFLIDSFILQEVGLVKLQRLSIWVRIYLLVRIMPWFFKLIGMERNTFLCDGTVYIGFNSTLRGGNVTHHEYIQVGKGRDVGLNQISMFEAKIANGNGEQTLSRDIYRLGHRFDFFRMLSCYFTTVGFYFSTLVSSYFCCLIAVC